MYDDDPLQSMMQFYHSNSDENSGEGHLAFEFSKSIAMEEELLKIAVARSLIDTAPEIIREHQARLDERLIECNLEYKKKVTRIITSYSRFYFCS